MARSRIAILLLAAGLAQGSEVVCLKTGFCLEAKSHSEQGEMVNLQLGNGEISFPAGDVAQIELMADAPAKAAVAKGAPERPVDGRTLVSEAAREEGLDEDFVRSVARIESNFASDALSKKGAMGLMQLIGPTARELGVDPLVARENASGGARYLRSLLLKYHHNSALALAAYNAGPGSVAHYGGVPPYNETRDYIVRVTREYDRLRQARSRTAAERKAEEWLSKPLSSSNR